jgi:pimeloyl-ACP methyl ester carboxylesterase
VNAPSVLFLHGLGSSAADQWFGPGWADLFESSGRPVIAPDLPGHGSSPKFTDPGQYADTVENMLALVRGQGSLVDGVGFSAGGQLLSAMAAAEPGLFRRIAIIGVGHRAIAGLAAGPENGPVASAELDRARDVLRRLKQTPGNDPAAIDAFVRGGLPRLDADGLRRISARTLLVIGDRDFTGEIGPYAPFIPDVSTLVVDGLDHFGATDDRRVIRAVLDFITR